MRLVTWNLRHGRPRRGFTSNPRLAHAVHELDPDVVAVQEVDRGVVRSWFVDQPALVAQAIDADAWHYAPARRLLLTGSDGIALCVRGTIDHIRVVDLPHPTDAQRRVAIVAGIVVGEDRVTVITTHLHNDAPVARDQLAALLDEVAGEPSPRVVLGDLNLQPSEVEGPLRGAGFELVGGDPTNPAWEPVQRIDHIAVDGLVVQRAWTPEMGLSDHRPVAVDVDVVTQEQVQPPEP